MNSIALKGVVAEDFVNFKVPCMFLITCCCDWKCCTEQNVPTSVCQNEAIHQQPQKTFSYESIFNYFENNDISRSIVIGGLEPILQFDEVLGLIDYFRQNGENCPFVIYTGYYPDEIHEKISLLMHYQNIYVKFGRYIPNDKPHYDDVLGINLASNNQYGVKIS